MKHIFYSTLMLFMLLKAGAALGAVTGQDTVFNQVDGKGLKQGYWKKEYPNGNLMYKGYFVNDKPVGTMARYFENGGVKAILAYDGNSEYAKAKIFYEDGSLASEGNYKKSRKDSIWNYYSYYDKNIRSKETYSNGLLNGTSFHYYPGGSVSEKIEWKDGKKQGVWEQYFEDGSLRLKASYIGDKLWGDFIVFQAKNFALTKGKFTDDLREGLWVFYNQDGSVNMQINYIHGKPENEAALTKQQQEFFRKVDENIGKFAEPDPYDFMPGNNPRGNDY